MIGKRLLPTSACLVACVTGAIAHPVSDSLSAGSPELLNNGLYDYSGYEAEVVEVVDADTVKLNIHVWPGRILTVDVSAPDIETPDTGDHLCAQQTDFARAAQASIRRNFPAGSWVYVNEVALVGEDVFAEIVRSQGGGLTSVKDVLLSRPGRWGVSTENAPFDWCFGQE